MLTEDQWHKLYHRKLVMNNQSIRRTVREVRRESFDYILNYMLEYSNACIDVEDSLTVKHLMERIESLKKENVPDKSEFDKTLNLKEWCID